MADHDELCPATIADGRWRARCECALIARARADEEKRGAQAESIRYRDAEAVAARLVEVIRVDDLRLRTQKGHTAQARRERDAARAEVAALRTSHRAALRDIAALEKVLADLRAKVSSGWVPELDHEARIAVLALIEEVGK